MYLTQDFLVDELCFQVNVFYVHGPDASRRDVDETVRTFVVRFAAAHGRSMPAHKSLMLSFNPLRLCFPFQVVADKPFLAKYTKGVKLLAAWDDLAATISTVPDFAYEGVTGRGCRVKYREMIAAHRQEIKNGEFTSGVREGMDDATHKALNTCMQQEDEAEENAAKSKRTLQNRRAK